MNKIKKAIVLACTFMCFASIAFAQCPDGAPPSCESFPATPAPPCPQDELGIVFIEDFDGSNSTNPPSFTVQCFQSSRDYLDIVCNGGDGCANEINTEYIYNGATGQYLGARDTDASNSIPFEVCDANQDGETVTFSGIDISPCAATQTVMSLCFTVAESRNYDVNGDGDFSDGPEWGNSNMREDTWDNNTEVNISVNVDGAGSTPITSLQAFEDGDTRPGIDLNCNGNSAGGIELTDVFTQYCFTLPTLGNTLDLELEFVGFNGGGEDVAIDNIIIQCPQDQECIPLGVLLPSCTPIVSAGDGQVWIEDFDGGNASNPPVFSYMCYDDNRDYFNIVCNDNSGCSQEVNDDYSYFGATGQFLGLRDTDGDTCDADQGGGDDPDQGGEDVSFNGIDITACAAPEVMYLCFTIAESQNQGGAAGAEWGGTNMRDDTWDGNTSIMITANVDATGFLPVTAFEAQVGSDSPPGVDLNCDGDSGDAGEVNLSDTFTQYCFNLPSLGTTLDLNFHFAGFNTGGEDVAIDNISVECGLPANVISLPGKTPFTP